MEFYRDISDYYDYIFPFKTMTYKFLEESYQRSLSNSKVKGNILDIACGSGSYALNLARISNKVIGTDLDPLMIQQAKNKNNKENLEFKVHNMLEINDLEPIEGGYDFIYCIGNSIVHLDCLDEMYSVISKVYNMLNKGGVFVTQIINFDRVLSKQVKELPTIINEDEGVTFKRDYIHYEDEHKITFSTILDVETDRITEQFKQSVQLYPMTCDEVYKGYEDAGFSDIELFGGFNNGEYHKDTSYALVIRGTK